MNQRIDIMVDLETLGRSGEYTVFQIGAVAFNIITGEVLDTLDISSDITKDKDFRVDPETLMWWLKTDKELLFNILENNNSIDSYDMFDYFKWWTLSLKNSGLTNIYLWGNGILFDNKIIQDKMEQYKLDYPIHYRNDRDLRTVIDLTANKLGITEDELKEKFNDDNLTKHNGLDDAKYQVKMLVYCWKILTE